MFFIAIPSANRVSSRYFKTVKLLRDIGFDMSRVYLFLDNEQVDLYRNAYDLDDLNIVSCDNKCIVDVRNYIEREYFKEGQHLVCLDDDINYIEYKDNDGEVKRLKEAAIFECLVNRAFAILQDNGCLLWGVYPIGRNRPWFLQARTEVGNNHIVAAFSGVIVKRDLPYQKSELACKEEYERGFIYGKNIRVGFMSIDTRYYTKDGIGPRSEEKQLETCQKIMQLYPNRYSRTPLKRNYKKGSVDLRLNKRYYD